VFSIFLEGFQLYITAIQPRFGGPTIYNIVSHIYLASQSPTCIYTYMVYLHLYAFVLDKPFWLFPVLTSCDLLSYRTMGKKVPATKVRVYGKTTPKTAPKSVAKKGKDGKDVVKPKNDKKVKKPVERKKDAKKDKKEKKDKEKEKAKEKKGKEKPVKRRRVQFDPTPVVVPPPPKGKDAKGEKTNKEEKPKETRPSALKSPCTPLKGNLAMVAHESQSPGEESASPSALGRDLAELERDRKAARKQGVSLEKFLAEKSEKAVEEHMQKLLKEAEAKENESSAETEAEEEDEEEPEEESESNPELEDEDQKEEEKEDAETDSSSDSAVEDSSDSSSEEEEEDEEDEEEEKEEKPGKSPKIVEKPKQSSEVEKAEACAARVEKEAVKQKANSIWS